MFPADILKYNILPYFATIRQRHLNQVHEQLIEEVITREAENLFIKSLDLNKVEEFDDWEWETADIVMIYGQGHMHVLADNRLPLGLNQIFTDYLTSTYWRFRKEPQLTYWKMNIYPDGVYGGILY